MPLGDRATFQVQSTASRSSNDRKLFVFAVTRVSPRVKAIAAIWPSTKGEVLPVSSSGGLSRPCQSAATSSYGSMGKERRTTAWRHSSNPARRCEIVRASMEGDFSLSRGLPHVRLRSPATTTHIREYIAGYAETLVALPKDTWRTSEALWTSSFWDVFVDLWTASEGRSDMVLSARVWELGGGYEFEVHAVYVP